jgi:riboflavin kinase
LAITQKGVSELRASYSSLRVAFEEIRKITGKVTDGVGDGKYYLSLPGYKNNIKEKFGMLPYPGTLNIKLKENEIWKKSALFDGAVIVPGFRYDGRVFGELFVKPCRVGKVPVVAVLPKRTHHPYEILELVSDKNLRKKLKIKSGDEVSVRL